MKVSWDYCSQYMEKKMFQTTTLYRFVRRAVLGIEDSTCSKPPTRYINIDNYIYHQESCGIEFDTVKTERSVKKHVTSGKPNPKRPKGEAPNPARKTAKDCTRMHQRHGDLQHAQRQSSFVDITGNPCPSMFASSNSSLNCTAKLPNQ